MLVLCVLIAATTAAPAREAAFAIEGWREAVLSVRNLQLWEDFWINVAGWEVATRADADPAWQKLWGLPDTVNYREVLLRNHGTESGFVRLIEFQGAPQVQIRSNGQTWETGGIFDINVRVRDLDGKFAELQARGWQGYADPIQLTFGPFTVREWLGRGPDGIVIALIQRLAPPLEGYPTLREFSRTFNSTQVVADIDESLRFYVDQLGFEVYVETQGPSEQPGPNVLGLPHNLVTGISRRTVIVHPEGGNDGSVELIEFDGATGRDFAALARPPNLGVLALRFPVSDVRALAAHLEDAGIELAAAPTRVELAPYGPVTVLALRGPNGEWLEFFQAS